VTQNTRGLTDPNYKRRRQSKQSGCPAIITCKYGFDGTFKVVHALHDRSVIHNHKPAQFATAIQRRFERPTIEMLNQEHWNFGISPTDSYDLIKAQNSKYPIKLQDLHNHRAAFKEQMVSDIGVAQATLNMLEKAGWKADYITDQSRNTQHILAVQLDLLECFKKE